MTKKERLAFLVLTAVILFAFLSKEYVLPLLTNSAQARIKDTPMTNVPSGPGDSLLISSEVFENMSLHLDDVEFLRNAFAVQALVGPLVRFSNRGRYEPYVAKNWTQSGNIWAFELHRGLTCEDGQKITAESFRSSLKRSLLRFTPEDIKETPFSALKGIAKFISHKDESQLGISASGEELRLDFTKPVGKALLEYLAMTPFAFLCESNFDGDNWKSRDKFVSSGPYKVKEFDPQSNLIQLELRKEWALNPILAFDRVYLSNGPVAQLKPTAEIQMSYALKKAAASGGVVREVPRALLSLRLGIAKDQFFANRKNRQALQEAVDEVLNQTEIPFENYHRAESFFFGQVTGHESLKRNIDHAMSPKDPLVIRGRPHGESADVDFYQGILFKALDKLGWRHSLDSKPITTVSQFYNAAYDIAYDRSHVDATLDPEFVRLLFKSKLGPRFQDPSERVSKLVEEFDKGAMPYRDFLIAFNAIISEEAAIIPMFHRGFTFKFTDNVDVKNISPLMSILRYEELTQKNNGT